MPHLVVQIISPAAPLAFRWDKWGGPSVQVGFPQTSNFARLHPILPAAGQPTPWTVRIDPAPAPTTRTENLHTNIPTLCEPVRWKRNKILETKSSPTCLMCRHRVSHSLPTHAAPQPLCFLICGNENPHVHTHTNTPYASTHPVRSVTPP